MKTPHLDNLINDLKAYDRNDMLSDDGRNQLNEYEAIKRALSLGDIMKWVTVSERLPEINQHVLVLRSSPNVVTTGYLHKYRHWIWSNLNGSTNKTDHIYKVTRWMPLPDPPCV